MQTLTIDILDDKAIRLIEDLELLKIIKVHKIKEDNNNANNIIALKGTMSKQPLDTIEQQLKELRNSWDSIIFGILILQSIIYKRSCLIMQNNLSILI